MRDGTRAAGGRVVQARIAANSLDRQQRLGEETTWADCLDAEASAVLVTEDEDKLYRRLGRIRWLCHVWQCELGERISGFKRATMPVFHPEEFERPKVVDEKEGTSC